MRIIGGFGDFVHFSNFFLENQRRRTDAIMSYKRKAAWWVMALRRQHKYVEKRSMPKSNLCDSANTFRLCTYASPSKKTFQGGHSAQKTCSLSENHVGRTRVAARRRGLRLFLEDERKRRKKGTKTIELRGELPRTRRREEAARGRERWRFFFFFISLFLHRLQRERWGTLCLSRHVYDK